MCNGVFTILILNSIMVNISSSWKYSYFLNKPELLVNFTNCSDSVTNILIAESLEKVTMLFVNNTILFFITNVNWIIPLIYLTKKGGLENLSKM